MRPTQLATGTILSALTVASFLAICSKQPSRTSAVIQPPPTIYLTGIVRDFKEWTVPGGQADMEKQPDTGFGRYSGNVKTTLGSDDKPEWTGNGHKVTTQWRDSVNRQICHALFSPNLGDKAGSWGTKSTGGIQSATTFNQWYHDVPGINLSAPLTLTLNLQNDGTYLFDDKLDPVYSQRSGFFPIDNMLFGNSGGSPDHNYHFTFELHATFIYDANLGQMFKFIGDDDVWVYINKKLVMDLGGVHAAHDQYVDVNRLGLVHGQTYSFDFFYAERHRTQSNFRVQTNIFLTSIGVPTVTGSYD